MRKPSEVTSDRALVLYVLHLTESMGLMSDVKLQQLLFLCELQMLGKGLRGLHFEFVRFPYGAFSKDVDNDLLFLRRKERLENFDLTEEATQVVSLLEHIEQGDEGNHPIFEIVRSLIEQYGPHDTSALMKAVEAVELCPADNPEQKLAIRDISFHTIMLVPSRVETTGALTMTPAQVKKLNAAMGY